jgi:phage repressor protein C with HTH and peptisase S24 domain
VAEPVKTEVAERAHKFSADFRNRLRLAVQNGGGKSAIVRRSGVPDRSLGHYLAGSADPKPYALARIAVACGVNLNWLLLGEGENWHSRAEPGDERPELAFSLVRRLAFRASAGNGSLVLDEEAGTTAFPKAILGGLHLKVENARILTAIGESMRPTIEDGDPLLIDTSDLEVIDGRIYVFTIGDQVLLKRLRRRGKTLLMRADNRDLYPDEEEVPQIEPVLIVGRVRWVGRSL